MIFTQYYLDCLSQASYLIGDETTGQAVRRRPAPRRRASTSPTPSAHGLQHRRRDQHPLPRRLPRRAPGAGRRPPAPGSATGSRAETEYPIRHLADGERISLGDVTLEIMETPGHTPESISVLVYEHAGDAVPYGVLTGDALFIGDVGRPDLLASIGVHRRRARPRCCTTACSAS